MDKLKNFPHVYYFTLEGRNDRQKYMESQFDRFNIDYTKVCMTKVSDQLILNSLYDNHSNKASKRCLAYNCHIIKTLRDWYNNCKDELIILMEDDYDLSLIDYWHFSWGYLLSKLPYDWDCIQLGFECPDIVRFYLHPIQSNYSLGPSLLNRDYVKKLIDLYYKGGKYTFKGTVANSIYLDRESGISDNGYFIDLAGTPDYFICQNGRTYSLPLIPCNPFFEGSTHKGSWYPMKTFIFCYEAYYEWWINDRDNFTLDDFFTYGKNTDILMQRDITRWDNKYFHEKALREYNEKYLPHPTTV